MPATTDAELIAAVLQRLDGVDHVRAGDELGVSEGTVRRWRQGDRRPLRRSVRTRLRRYIEGHTLPPHGQVTIDQALVLRLLRSIPPDRATRLRLVQVLESEFLARNLDIPAWLEAIRSGVLTAAAGQPQLPGPAPRQVAEDLERVLRDVEEALGQLTALQAETQKAARPAARSTRRSQE